MREKDEVIEKLEELILDLKASALFWGLEVREIKNYPTFDYERGKIEALKWVLEKTKYI